MLSVTMAALNAAQKEMNVTANNLANASTVGFKRSFANFGDVFSNDPASNPKTAVGAGVLTTSISRDTSAGALKSTGRVTDLAIDGRGLFITRDPAGTANTFSRAGNFILDANGYVVDPGGFQLMGFATSAGGNSSSLIPIQAKPQFVAGETLPDGTRVGCSVQMISFDGPATATGFISVGDVNVPVTNGDSVEQIALNVQNALSQAPSFAGRSVSIVGSGSASQIKIEFGPTESVTTPLSIGTPAANSPSARFSTNSALVPEIQKISYYAATNNLHVDNTAIIIDGPDTITIPVAADAPIAETVRAYLSDPTLAPSFVGRTVSLDPANPQNLLIQFGANEGDVPIVGIAGTHGAQVSIAQNYQNIPNVEQITAQPASADGVLDVAGVSVPVTAGEDAATIANHIQTALAQAFPLRTISRSNDIITMTYLASEANAPLVQPKLTVKRPTNGQASITSDGGPDLVLLQGLSISPKGMVQGTYSNNATYTLGYLGIATFPNDGGLKATGNNRFSETGLSGAASLTPAGAPRAGNIMAGTLEQANVDITNELMDMIRAQQVYNGNARMMQTTIESVQRITDRI